MPDETYKGSFSGHVMRPNRATYERFKADLTDVKPMDIGSAQAGEEHLQGVHPVYGHVALSTLLKSAARPNAPSYTIIIMTNDDAVAAAARLNLDNDPMP